MSGTHATTTPRPFEGVRVIDITHVLAGPFATYQLAVHGAEVIKVESPSEPDMVRIVGGDSADNSRLMGTAFLVQSSNKRAKVWEPAPTTSPRARRR